MRPFFPPSEKVQTLLRDLVENRFAADRDAALPEFHRRLNDLAVADVAILSLWSCRLLGDTLKQVSPDPAGLLENMLLQVWPPAVPDTLDGL
jgi:hypothetical protein